MAKVGVLSGHIDEEEFGEVPGANTLLIFLRNMLSYCEGLANGSHFFLVLGPLLGDGFAISDFGDEFMKSDHLDKL